MPSKIPATKRDAKLLLKLLRLLATPRKLTRAEKRAAGLKYCREAGYGFRWLRGKRVADEGEQYVINSIVEWRNAGYSWHRIASALMQGRIFTKNGTEWSMWRVRRAYLAATAQRRSGGQEDGTVPAAGPVDSGSMEHE